VFLVGMLIETRRRQPCINGEYFGDALIELLVVIAIIAIVAALLVFSRGLAKSRSAVCLSNVKQLHNGSAMLGMHWDYDESFPGSWPALPGPVWHEAMVNMSTAETQEVQADGGCRPCPYTKSTQVYFCPTNWHEQSYGYAYPTR